MRIPAQGGILRDIDFNFAEAEAEFRRALELAPQDAARDVESRPACWPRLGRLDEAVALAQRAIALEPLRSASHHNLALNLTALGRYDEAEAAVRKAIELQPQAARTICSLRLFRFCAANPERRWNSRKRKPIRSGAPTHWRWPTLPTATGRRPTRP